MYINSNLSYEEIVKLHNYLPEDKANELLDQLAALKSAANKAIDGLNRSVLHLGEQVENYQAEGDTLDKEKQAIETILANLEEAFYGL